MKYIVCVDTEGVACAVGEPGKYIGDSRNDAMVFLQATREADAAAKALFESGATRVIVWDNHGASLNLHYDLLDERCEIALGAGFPHRIPGLENDFAGILFVGYHASGGTFASTMAHTYSSRQLQTMSVNGEEVGEMAMDGAVAGETGVPVIFASSDDKGVAEARKYFPWAVTVETKVSYGWNAAISKHPRRVLQEIGEGVRRAVKKSSEHKIFRFPDPFELAIRYQRNDAAEKHFRSQRGWEMADTFTVTKKMRSIHEYFG